MISIDRIRIRGFRGIANLEMTFTDTCVLIGPNNSGKTSVLRALEMALSESLHTVEQDFYCASCHTNPERFQIDVRFIPVDQNSKRQNRFSPLWQKAFGVAISEDRQHREFFAFRTFGIWNAQTQSASKSRFVLRHWDERESRIAVTSELNAIEYVPIDANANLRRDLANEDSFLNRALYALHRATQECCAANDPIFKDLQVLLNRLLDTLQGPGTRIPESFELSTHNIGHFFESVKADSNALVETQFQAKGTAKTIAILSIVTIMEMFSKLKTMRKEPLHFVIGAEEPETHLHPNAQRSLITQLKVLSHQLVVTTHSPYITSVAEPTEFRSMEKKDNALQVRWLPQNTDPTDVRTIKRLIMRFRGEVLFARGLIFVEGVTEEQLITGMFQAYFGHDPSELGINIIGVDGKSYAAFVMLALSLRKPFCIVSDNDGDTQHVVLKQIQEVEEKTRFTAKENRSEAFFLSPGQAMEGELARHTGLKREIIDSLIACTVRPGTPEQYIQGRREQMKDLSNLELKRRLEKKKSEYSAFLGDTIVENPYSQPIEAMLPKAVLRAFQHIELWLKEPA